MQEFREITDWIASQEQTVHRVAKVSPLPSPNFECKGRTMASFKTNNYPALANDPRMNASARKCLHQFGVANCESRRLGGDIDIYMKLGYELTAIKGKETAMLHASGYFTNDEVLSALSKSGLLPGAFGFINAHLIS